MANRDVVAIGTSAGGVRALHYLVERLPAGFPASILVTIHLPSYRRSVLDELLAGAGKLGASFAQDGERLRKGHIFVAPPDRHLLLEGDNLSLGSGPRENNSRPAIDPMLRSVALCCGPRAIGVVLTGTLGDGASGLWAIDQSGGITVVQDPKDAAFPDMPENALRLMNPDHIASMQAMPMLLQDLVRQPVGEARPVPERIGYEVSVAKNGRTSMNKMDRIGRRSVLACPDCHGVMWEIDEGDLIRYRCHVGHTYTADLMGVALDESVRRALASALRNLEERLALARKLQRDASERNHVRVAESWAERAREYEREMDIVHDAIRRIEKVAAAIA
jgi:two-component system chemotaxis response regulator CheB